MKLLQKILLPIILVILLSMSALSYLTYSQMSESLTESSINTMQVTSSTMQRMLDYAISSTKTFIKLTSENTLVVNFSSNIERGPDEVNAMNTWFEQHAHDIAMMNGFNLLDTNGVIMASSNPEAVGVDISFREYFKIAVTGEIPRAEPRMSTITNEVLMAVVFPVKDTQGNVVGVLSGDIKFSEVYDTVLKGISVGERGYAFAIDGKGRVVLDPNKEPLMKDDLPITPTMIEIAKGEDGVTNYQNLAGEQVIAYHSKLKNSDMTIIARSETRDIFASLDALSNLSIYTTITAIILSSIIALVIIRPVVTAVSQGANFASDIANGNLNGVLDIKRNDEIGDLANALHSIPATLNRVIHEYSSIEQAIRDGHIEAQGDASKFDGAYANLIEGTNITLQQYQNILNSLTSPVVAMDKNLHITYLNTIAKTNTGNDYFGKTFKEVINTDDADTEHDAIKIAVSTLKPATSETIARPGGQEIDISYTAIPIVDKDGALSCVLQIVTILTEIKKTQRTIIEVANQAQDISSRMATASRQLSTQVEEVALGAETQRDRVTTTAVAMEEMNSTVLEVANNAGDANTQSSNVREKATEGTDLVNQVVEAIKSVNEVARELEENMEQLGKQAESIGSVMDVISDIADQTNLLALNAAIEAARAGDAGRGFAVVADEVRKLAEKTMTATTEVGNSIRGVQQTTSTNITKVSESANFARKATELATISGNALEEILNLVNDNTALISGIAAAAEQQSATSEEINRSVDEINHIAGSTALGMSNASQAVRELSDMAIELQELLQRLMERK